MHVLRLVVPLLCCSLGFAALQTPRPGNASPPIQEIIERFAAAESQNKKARANYEYTQDYQLVELDATASVIGGFYRITDVVFDDKMQPFERIRYYPPPTMPNVIVTNEDMRDALGIQPFALTTDDLPKYQIDYVGKEPWAELSTYVFDVKPKHELSTERYFEGRIWVDAGSLQIVRVVGQAVPEVSDQKFPHFETLREKVDGNYWFPVYTSADDILKFKRSPQAHVRMTIRYSSYKKFSSTVCVQGDVESGGCEKRSAANAESAAKDSDEMKKAYQIQELVRQLSGEQKYREAIPQAERMLALYEGALGSTHPYVVAVLNQLADLYWKTEDYTNAESVLRRALAIQEGILGINHPDLALTIGKLIELCYVSERVEKAEPLVARLLPIIEKARSAGRTPADLSLSSIGGLYLSQEQYGRAEQLLKQLLSVKEQVVGEQSPDLINLLTGLAKLYIATATYEKAESILARAQTIVENDMHPEPRKTAGVFNALGTLHYLRARYPEAETCLVRARKLLQESSDRQPEELALVLNNLGMVHYAKAEFDEAESSFEDARQLVENAFGPEDVRVGLLLNQIGLIYYTRGNYGKAKALFTDALRILKNKLDAKHPDLANSYSNLGTVDTLQGDYVEAERLLSFALSIREDAVGQQHPDLTPILNNLAVLFASKGDFQRAEDRLKRAIEIEEKVPSAKVDLGIFLSQLAALYISNDDDEKAREPLERSLAILEKALGPEHRVVAITRITLAGLYTDTEDYERAKTELDHALPILTRSEPDSPYIGVIHARLADISVAKKDYAKAEAELQKARANIEYGLGSYQPDAATILQNLAAVNENQGRVDLAIQLTTRANDISEQTLLRNLVAGSERQKILFLNNLSDELDHTISLHVRSAPHNPQALRLALTTLFQRKGRALDVMTDSLGALSRNAAKDPELARAFVQLSDARSQYAAMVFKASADGDPGQDRKKLGDLEQKIDKMERDLNDSSVEFRLQSQPVTLDAVQAAIPEGAALIEFLFYFPFDSKAMESDAPHYVVYIMRTHGTPEWVDLGSAERIYREVAKFRESLRGNLPDVQQRARALDELVMRPVRARLNRVDKKIKRLLISPDAELSLFPFAALVDETNHYLVENYSITYVNCGRDLLRLQSSLPSKQGPLIVASPNFDLELKPSGAETQPAETLTERRRPKESLGRFSPLDEAPTEARALSRVLKEAPVLSGDQATEASVKQVHGPRILHLITHGFFLENQKRIGKNLQESMWGSNISPSAIALNENPLLRSGLALAGANKIQNENTDDGVLTALEAAGLDLWGTKLVVLSACETGLGDVENGQGVFGLRRAFVLAGAESQVMSLWKVNDEATRFLMVKYYQRLMSGEGRGEALRQVQLEMLREAKYSHPYFWASFVESGNWRNLDNQ